VWECAGHAIGCERKYLSHRRDLEESMSHPRATTATVALDAEIRTLAQAKNYAIVSTHMPDGSIQSQPLWVDADDDHLLLNTEIHRQRYKNVQRDPRITVLVIEEGGWYRHAEVRGRVVGEVRGQEARDHIDALAKKYMGVDDYPNPIQSERVILKVVPERQILFPPS